MRARKVQHFDLGEAISMEDAISMMTIIFVLFVIFLVPLVSIDKALLEEQKTDDFWGDMVRFLSTSNSSSVIAPDYQSLFSMNGTIYAHVDSVGSQRIIEVLHEDSSFVVVSHNLKTNRYTKMDMAQHGISTVYYHGTLKYQASPVPEWYSDDEIADWGSDERSKIFEKKYKTWRTKRMEGLK